MSEQRRRHALWIVSGIALWLALVGTLASIETHAWLGRLAPPPASSVFDQPVAPSTDQPIIAENLARLHAVWTDTVAPVWTSRVTVAGGVVYALSTNAAGSALTAIRDGAVLWRGSIPNAASSLGGVCISGGAAFIRTTTDLYTFEAQTGHALWRLASEAALDDAVDTVACAGATVYVATARQVQALDAMTGKPLWSFEYAADPSSAYSPFGPRLAADAGSLYLFLTTSPYVTGPAITALDARRGTVRWQIEEKGAQTGVYGVAPLVGANGVVYWLSGRNVVALDPMSGATLWSAAASTPARSVASSMSLDADHLYVAGRGYVRTFDLNNGRLAWQAQLPGTDTHTEMAVSGGVVYVATATLFIRQFSLLGPPPTPLFWLYAFDTSSGRLLRKLQDNDRSFGASFLAADAKRVYVAGARTVGGSGVGALDSLEIYGLGL